MCRSNWASYIPPSRNFTFFQYFVWNIEYWKGEIPRISKEGSEMPRGPEGGMYDAKFEPNITHFRKFCLEKNFWKCSKSLNYWKKRCFKKLPFLGQFPKKCLREVLATRPKSGVKSWKVMRFWLFFWRRIRLWSYICQTRRRNVRKMKFSTFMPSYHSVLLTSSIGTYKEPPMLRSRDFACV